MKKLNDPKISIVVAMAKNRVIGKENKIPWHLTPDLVRFKEKCSGHTVIMGRKTFESLLGYYEKSGKELPGKTYIIVTSDATYHLNRKNCLISYSFDDALVKAKEIEQDEVIIGGGGSIYQQAIAIADRLYVTLVDLTVAGDTFFPAYGNFTKVIEETPGIYKNIKYIFLTLENG